MSFLSKAYSSVVGPYRGLPLNEKIRLFIISVAAYSIFGLSISAVLYIVMS
jgi:hypothetical protein